jgi:hypothetical protein
VAYNKHGATMKPAMRNLFALAVFLLVLTILTGSRSRSLRLVLGLGFMELPPSYALPIMTWHSLVKQIEIRGLD